MKTKTFSHGLTRIGRMDADEKTGLIYEELTYKIIGLAMEVWNKLGSGFLEKVYENSLMVTFERDGIEAKQQFPVEVIFEGKNVGHYVADILVVERVILEIKTADAIVDAHVAQTLNYLKATGKRVGLILNFSKKPMEYKRVVL